METARKHPDTSEKKSGSRHFPVSSIPQVDFVEADPKPCTLFLLTRTTQELVMAQDAYYRRTGRWNNTVPALLMTAVLAGCAKVQPIDEGSYLSLVVLESPGGNCRFGGVRHIEGIDDDHDGKLTGLEIGRISFICSTQIVVEKGGILSEQIAVPAGGICDAGGYIINTGKDENSDGRLQQDEIMETAFVCHRAVEIEVPVEVEKEVIVEVEVAGKVIEALVKYEEADACVNGGVVIQSGLDLNADGVLSSSEVSETREICAVKEPDESTAFFAVQAGGSSGSNYISGAERMDTGATMVISKTYGSVLFAPEGPTPVPVYDQATMRFSLFSASGALQQVSAFGHGYRLWGDGTTLLDSNAVAVTGRYYQSASFNGCTLDHDLYSGFAGESSDTQSEFATNAYVAILAPSGCVRYLKDIQTSGEIDPLQLHVLSDGSYLVIGLATGTVVVDSVQLTPDVSSETERFPDQIFAIHYDKSGKLRWVGRLADMSGNSRLGGSVVLPSDDVVISARLQGVGWFGNEANPIPIGENSESTTFVVSRISPATHDVAWLAATDGDMGGYWSNGVRLHDNEVIAAIRLTEDGVIQGNGTSISVEAHDATAGDVTLASYNASDGSLNWALNAGAFSPADAVVAKDTLVVAADFREVTIGQPESLVFRDATRETVLPQLDTDNAAMAAFDLTRLVWRWVQPLSSTGRIAIDDVSVHADRVLLSAHYSGEVAVGTNQISLDLPEAETNASFFMDVDVANGSIENPVAVTGTIQEHAGGNDEVSDICGVEAEGLAATGHFEKFARFGEGTANPIPVMADESEGPGSDRVDGFVARYNAAGVPVWVNRLGGGGEDLGKFIEQRNHRLVVAGSFQKNLNFSIGSEISMDCPDLNDSESVASAPRCGFLAGFDATSGDVEWTSRIYRNTTGYDSLQVSLWDMAPLGESDVLVVGTYGGEAIFDNGDTSIPLTSSGGSTGYQVFLAQYNGTTGEVVRAQNLFVNDAYRSVTVHSIDDGSLVVVNGNDVVYLNADWQERWRFSGAAVQSVTQVSKEHIAIAGHFTANDEQVIGTSPSTPLVPAGSRFNNCYVAVLKRETGSVLWHRTMNTSDPGHDSTLNLLQDGAILLTSATGSSLYSEDGQLIQPPDGVASAFFNATFDPETGDVRHTTQFAFSDYRAGLAHKIVILQDSFYAAGWFEGTIRIQNSSAVFQNTLMTSTGEDDIFIARIPFADYQ